MENKQGQRPFFHTFKKNDIITGCAVDMSDVGYGVVKVDGFVCFVKELLVGECAEILLLKVEKSYGYGKVISRYKSSPSRVDPVCLVVDQCGGCQLLHMDYREQLLFKQQVLNKAFNQAGFLDAEILPVLAMHKPLNYRNKVAVPVKIDEKVTLGFYRQHSHDIVEFQTCYVQTDHQNQILKWIRSFLSEFPIKTIKHIVLRENQNQEVMVGIVTTQFPFAHQQTFIEACIQTFSFVKSIVASVKTKENNVILGEKEHCIYGDSVIVDQLMGLDFEISLHSFYQVNPIQTQVLYNQVRKSAKIQNNETVLDLYCGIGTIGLMLAKDAKKVIGVEINPQAIIDAKRNALRNNIDNVDFFAMDVAGIKKQLSLKKETIDVVIVDPPRSGLDLDVIAHIQEINPDRIVYVSCNPKTLVRDCALFKQQYVPTFIQPVDMFGQTYHIETVVLMSRQNR